MSENLSIYIHWPFCKSLCPYCDFNSHISEDLDLERWHNAYIKELEYMLSSYGGVEVESIFFGGGTPSLMDPKLVSRIIDRIAKMCKLDNTEITLEANPTSTEAAKFRQFRDAGINRLSLGVQSLLDKDLKILGREHNALGAKKAIETAANYFDNYSFDLIYGRPAQELIDWEQELKEAINLAANHLSVYLLTIEKATPFYDLARKGILKMQNNEILADFIITTNQIMEDNNYKRYEISNYTRSNFECRHNLRYWNYKDYIGIGAGAHSRTLKEEGVASIMMHHKPEKWLNQVESQNHGVQNNKLLDQKQIIQEIIMMGLRSISGVSEDLLKVKSGADFNDILDMGFLELVIQENLLIYDRGSKNICLTTSGMNLHSYIVSRVLDI